MAQRLKNLPANAGGTGDAGLNLELERSPGVGSGNPLQYSCLENCMDRGAWWATVQGVARVRPRLSDKAHLSCMALLGGSQDSPGFSNRRPLKCVPTVLYAKSIRRVTRSLSLCLAAGTVTHQGPRERVPSWRPRAHLFQATAVPSSNKPAAIRTLSPRAE